MVVLSKLQLAYVTWLLLELSVKRYVSFKAFPIKHL